MHEQIARGLEQARGRTLGLTEIDEPELTAQHSALMSPLVWDLAHIGQQEDLWLLRGGNAAAQGLLSCRIEQLYDAFEHPRARRVDLPLLTPTEARSFIADVRGRVLDGLERVPDGSADELFTYAMVEQHEQQHVETMLATHQLRRGAPLLGPGAPLPPGRLLPSDGVLVPAGPFLLGVDGTDEPWSLDNERPAHAGRPPGLPDRSGPGQQRRVAVVHRCRRLPRPAVVVAARLEAPAGRRPGTAVVLVRGRFPAAVRTRRGRAGRRAGAARELLRGRGLRGLRRCPPADRAGVGEGLRLGSRTRSSSSLALGRLAVVPGAGQPRR